MEAQTKLPIFLVVLLVLIGSPACAAVAGIFKAGIWVGVIAAVLVVGIVLLIARGMRG